MPRAGRVCPALGCPEFAGGGRCPAHRAAGDRTRVPCLGHRGRSDDGQSPQRPAVPQPPCETLVPGSLCWLCGAPIDFAAPARSSRSPSAHHLDPVSLGGHQLGPMKPAHLGCNASYGNGTKPSRMLAKSVGFIDGSSRR